MGRLFDRDTYLQNDEEPNTDAIYVPYYTKTCKDCKYCEERRKSKFTSVFYCNKLSKFVSPNSKKDCLKE